MDLAVLEQKNPVNAWRKAQNLQRKNRKKNGSASRKSKQAKNDFELGEFLKTLTTGVAKAILIAACSYGAFMGYRFINSSLHFSINKVNWLGQQRLSTEDLTSWVGPIMGKNIFQLNINKVSQKLVEHPWIQAASVRRIFPQDVYIELKERVPFARVQLDQVYVMDNYGILLGPEEGKFDGLPLVTGISVKNPMLGNNVANEKIIRGLKTMYHINLLPMFKKNPIDTVRIISKSRVTFVTHNRNIEVHMRPEMAQESFKNLLLVLGTIEADKRDIGYIDLSFKNKVVVRHKKAKTNSERTKKK